MASGYSRLKALIIKFLTVLADTAFRVSIQHAPYTRWGDRYFSYGQFFRSHKRFPTDSMLLNDYTFRFKLSDAIRPPLVGYTSDKEFTKDYIRAKVGQEYNVPTLAILRSKQEIQNFEFPMDCVIKPTHGSGKVIFRRNGDLVDRKEIQSWMDMNYYKKGREANYKYLQPKIIVEPYVFELKHQEDIKIFCYNGEPKVIRCSFDKTGENTRRFYTADWYDLDISLGQPLSSETMGKPEKLENMLEIARKLSADFKLDTRINLADFRQM